MGQESAVFIAVCFGSAIVFGFAKGCVVLEGLLQCS